MSMNADDKRLLGMAAQCVKADLNEIGAWFISEHKTRARRKRMLQKYAMVMEAMVAGIDLELDGPQASAANLASTEDRL